MNTQNTVINNTVELNILQNSNYQFVTLVKCSLENNFQSFISDEELPCVKDQFTREGGNKRTCPPLSLGVGGTRIKVCFLPLPPPPLPSPLPSPSLPFPPLPLSRDYLALRSVRGYNDIPWSNSEIRWNKPSVESQWSLCPQGLRGGGEGEKESRLLCTI